MPIHFLNNFSAVSLYHIIGDDELIKSDTSANPDELTSYVIMFLGLTLLFVALIILINKYYAAKKLLKEN